MAMVSHSPLGVHFSSAGQEWTVVLREGHWPGGLDTDGHDECQGASRDTQEEPLGPWAAPLPRAPVIISPSSAGKSQKTGRPEISPNSISSLRTVINIHKI